MGNQVDWLTLAGSAVFYVIVLVTGFIAAKVAMAKGSKTSTDTAANQVMVGYRNFGWFVSIATISATWVGATAISGGAERTYTHGIISGCVLSYSLAFNLLLGGFLIAKKMRTEKYVTVMDPFQNKCGKKVGVLYVITAFVAELCCVGASLTALGATLAVVANIKSFISVLISGFIAISYTMFGGIFSVAYTDIVQLSFVLVGALIAIPFAATNQAIQPKNMTEIFLGDTPYTEYTTIVTEMDTFFQQTLGCMVWQCYCQRILACKSTKVAVIGSYISFVVTLFLSTPSIIIGAIASSIGKLGLSFIFLFI